jgi:hypothetical protein
MALLFSETRTAIAADADSVAIKALHETMYVLVNTTDATAGTLDIEVEWSLDGTTWVSFSTPDTLTQITVAGETWLAALPARAQFLRLAYTVVTGPFTFEISVIGF